MPENQGSGHVTFVLSRPLPAIVISAEFVEKRTETQCMCQPLAGREMLLLWVTLYSQVTV